MKDVDKDLVMAQIVALMTSYSFDTDRYSPSELVEQWLQSYPIHWIRLATIEALYLGRYKAISVEQIMFAWDRKGQPNTHFGGDFERLICRKLPRHLTALDSISEEEKPADDRTFVTPKEEKDDSDSVSLKPNPDNNSPVSIPLISTKVTPPAPKSENKSIELPKHSQEESSPKEVDSSHNNKSQGKGIATFKPIPDASDFFKKLKALADNQRKKNKQ